MLDSSLLKQLEMSLLLGTVWHSHGFKPQLKTLSWKSTVAHRTLSICDESRAGSRLDHTHTHTHTHTDIRVNTHITQGTAAHRISTSCELEMTDTFFRLISEKTALIKSS